MATLNSAEEIELNEQELETVRQFFSKSDGARQAESEAIDHRLAAIEASIEAIQRDADEVKLRREIFGQREPMTYEDIESVVDGLNLESPKTVFESNILNAVITAAKDGGSITATQALGN